MTTVSHHFKLLEEYIEKHDIPWENIYNMDEQTNTARGGRKGTQQKFFFSRSGRANLKIQSGELELVTIVEVVCADGSSTIKPGFIFSGVRMRAEWCEEDGIM